MVKLLSAISETNQFSHFNLSPQIRQLEVTEQQLIGECGKSRVTIDWIHFWSSSSGALGPFQHPQQLCELWGGVRTDGPREGTMSMILSPLQPLFDSSCGQSLHSRHPPGHPPAHSGTRGSPLVAEDRLFKDVQPPCGRGHHWKISRTLWHDLTMTEGMINPPPDLLATAPTRRMLMKGHFNSFSQVHEYSRC